MAAPIRLMGLYLDHVGREPYIGVVVGKSDALRRVPLSEDDLLRLLRDTARALEALKKARGA